MKNHWLGRSPVAAVAAALMLAACSSGGTTVHSESGSTKSGGGADPNKTYATTAQVLDAVQAAQTLQTLPAAVAAGLKVPDYPKLQQWFDCQGVDNPSEAEVFGNCTYGDPEGSKLMVIYGDSHSDMWAASLEGVAKKNGWKLKVFAKHACPAPDLQFLDPRTKAPDTKCDQFHSIAPAAVKALHPNLIIVTSLSDLQLANGDVPTQDQWQQGWTATLNDLSQPGTRLAMIGDLPHWQNDDMRCLAAHPDAVQECSMAVKDATSLGYYDTEKAVAAAAGAVYVNTIPWICADRCQPVIADTRVYTSPLHITQSYAAYLTGAVNEALQPALA